MLMVFDHADLENACIGDAQIDRRNDIPESFFNAWRRVKDGWFKELSEDRHGAS